MAVDRVEGDVLELSEARRRCMERAQPGNPVLRPLDEAAGSYLARAVVLPEDVPPFHRAVMDGYAVRSGDVANASPERPAVLTVIGEVPAGQWLEETLRPGTAVRTMTGAPLAQGADAVVRLEDVRYPAGSQGRPGERIEISVSVKPWEAVQRQGEDLARGSAPLGTGTAVGPSEAALLAAAGAWEVEVYPKPVVAVLSTGDELLDGPGQLKPGQIRNSNGSMLRSMLRLEGWEVRDGGKCPDSVEAVAEAVERAFAGADAVVTTGAVSVGDFDVVPAAMERLGMEILFRRVAIRPGRPVAVGVWGRRMWFALPGNPASAFVTAHLFLLPALRKMAGAVKWDPFQCEALLAGRPPERPAPLTRFWRGRVQIEGGRVTVDAAREQSSSALSSFLGANALAEIPPGENPQPGDPVKVWWLGSAGLL